MKMATLGPSTELRTCSGVNGRRLETKSSLVMILLVASMASSKKEPVTPVVEAVLFTWYVSKDASVYMLVHCALSLTICRTNTAAYPNESGLKALRALCASGFGLSFSSKFMAVHWGLHAAKASSLAAIVCCCKAANAPVPQVSYCSLFVPTLTIVAVRAGAG